MKMFKGFYFPGTSPGKELLFSLGCLLDRIDYYRIVEGNGTEEEPSRYWQERVVLPLGGDRQRFLAMVDDIRKNTADYYSGYLSNLPTGGDRGDSSVSQLIASLHGKNGQNGNDPAEKEKIWQARLVLQLAEKLAEDLREVDLGLADLNRAERKVFKALKGDGDEDDEVGKLVGSAVNISAPAAEGSNTERLLKAWSVIHRYDSEVYQLAITDSAEAMSLLSDSWQGFAGKGKAKSFKLVLPSLENPEAVESCRIKLGQVRTDIISGLYDVLNDDMADKSTLLEKHIEQWREKVDQMAGRKCSLDLTVVPEHLYNEAWSRVSGIVGKKMPPEGNRLVGLLKPAP